MWLNAGEMKTGTGGKGKWKQSSVFCCADGNPYKLQNGTV